MKKISALFTLAFAISSTAFAADNLPSLRFHDGHFRIAQFTDFHWGHNGFSVEDNRNMVFHVVETQKPDLIVLTGDNVTDGKSETGWNQIISMLEETKVPYAIVLGNHDAECEEGVTADTIFGWLQQRTTRCMNAYGAKGIYGHGNKALPILSEKGDRTASVVYCIDSNDYPQDPDHAMYSYYDYIHPDQIAWYVNESNHFTTQNNGKPVPSVAYFHICVPEFQVVADDPTHFGRYQEPTCPAGVNTGFFGAAYIQKDIMGMFVGHDHSNDYIGIHNGIALAYGRQSGVIDTQELDLLFADADEIARTPQGSRIVELTEGQRVFSTWVCSMKEVEPRYYYPLGFNDSMKQELHPAVDVKVTGNGIAYRYYENGGTESCADMFSKGKLVEEGVMDNFDISKARAEDYFGYDFTSYLLIDESGPYRFTLSSDDGSVLYIDGVKVVDNDGSHSGTIKYGFIGLEKGYHHLQLHYFEDYSGQSLNLTYGSMSLGEQAIPSNKLFLTKTGSRKK